MTEEKEITGKFQYEQDSKRYHRFQIITDEGIVGTVYVPKNIEAMPMSIKKENGSCPVTLYKGHMFKGLLKHTIKEIS